MKYVKVVIVVSLLLFIACKRPEVSEKSDKVLVRETIKKLLDICGNVDFLDPKTTELGMFYKAAPYVVYRGENEERRWKDFANYNNPDERQHVDGVCTRLNETINRIGDYSFGKFFTEVESEGKWYVQEVIYKVNGRERSISLAFLKIKGTFALGDID